MKFSDYFLTPGVRTIAVLFGLLAGGTAKLFAAWQYALLVGACAALAFSLIVPLLLWRAEAPYRRIKATIKQPFLIDERVRFTVRGGSVGGYFILTGDSIVLLSVERGDQRMELSRDDIKSLVPEETSIRIFLNNTQYVSVITAAVEEIYEILEREGWGR